MYTVHFVGLNYFNACTVGQKNALIPNGTRPRPNDHVPPHFASLFIEAEHYDSDTWWDNPDLKLTHEIQREYKLGEFRTAKVMEFRIPKEATIDFANTGKKLLNVNLDDGLPKLQDVGFVLDDEHPDAIADVPLPGGELEVFRFGSAALVRWAITDHEEPITIRTTVDGIERVVTLKKSDPQLPTEIVFSNTVNLLPLAKGNGHNGGANHDGMQPAGNDDGAFDGGTSMGGMHMGSGHGAAGHFVLYAKLDQDRDETKFENPDLPDFSHLAPLPFSHSYLAFLSSLEEVPDAPCVPSCCGGKA